MLIGLGGGAASSINSGEQNEDLDFAPASFTNSGNPFDKPPAPIS
jgi:phosphoribosylformylglycinamidine (FGAM) synthase-like enzyme